MKPADDSLTALLDAAKRKVLSMTPEQKREMIRQQRGSFVRAMTTPCEHGVLDFETCPACRGVEQK